MIEPLMVLDWRACSAGALLLLGAGLVAAGLRSGADRRRRRQRPLGGAFAYLHAFRGVVVGLAIVGIGVGWGWQIPWLVAAGLCIGVGELLESTYYIEMLRWGQRRGVLTPTTASPAVGMRPTPG